MAIQKAILKLIESFDTDEALPVEVFDATGILIVATFGREAGERFSAGIEGDEFYFAWKDNETMLNYLAWLKNNFFVVE